MVDGKIRFKTEIAILAILILFLGEYYMKVLAFKYSDEVFCMFGLIILTVDLVSKRFRDNDNIKYEILLAVVAAGLFSNFTSSLLTSIFPICVDILSVTKAVVLFLVFRTHLDSTDVKRIAFFYRQPAKLFLIIATLCGIFSLFFNIGMSGVIRFGISSFTFIYTYHHILAVMALCSLMTITIAHSGKVSKFYTVLTCILLFLTTKGASFVGAAVLLLLLWFYKKHRRIKMWTYVLIGLIMIALGGFQIQNYFMHENSPRMLFYKYGAETALTYFPIGSGFGTFGSDVASRYYSPLYRAYSFSGIWGMNEDFGGYLNDNYWPMIMGQFGLFAVVAMLLIFAWIIKDMQKINNRAIKALSVSCFLYILVHSLGSGIITTSAGTILFVFVALGMNFSNL